MFLSFLYIKNVPKIQNFQKMYLEMFQKIPVILYGGWILVFFSLRWSCWLLFLPCYFKSLPNYLSLERRKYFDVVVVRATAMRNIFDMIARILLKNRNPVASKVMMILLLSPSFLYFYFFVLPSNSIPQLERYVIKIAQVCSTLKKSKKNKIFTQRTE